MGSGRKRAGHGAGASGKALVRELGLGLLAIPVVAISLVLIAVVFQVALEMSTGVLEAVVAFAIAIVATVVALALIGWIAGEVLAPAAVGWMAMFAGRLPTTYGPGARNLGRGMANLIFTAVAAALGVKLFRYGLQDSELTYAIEGLMLCGSAVVFGVVPAVPRFYFARWGKRRPLEEIEGESVIALVVTASLGIGLSLALSFGINDSRPPRGVRTLRPDIWASGCVASEEQGSCAETRRYALETKTAGWLFIQVRGQCANLKMLDADDQPVAQVPWVELYRAGIKTFDKESKTHTEVFDVGGGQRFELELSKDPEGTCLYRVRYLSKPPKGKRPKGKGKGKRPKGKGKGKR